MSYLPRIVDQGLDELFPELPAIALDGAKGVGKTATASQRAVSIVHLDNQAQQSVVAADPDGILDRPRPLLLDEWQFVPDVWDVVRHSVDEDRSGEQFLFTGSASSRLGAPHHSGAGRIVRLRMRPMTLTERGVAPGGLSLASLLQGTAPKLSGDSPLRLSDYVAEIVASGFPGLRGLSSRALRAQLDGYIRNVVDRDIPEQGLQVRRPDVLLDWLRAYAAATSTTASYTEILNAATAGVDDKPSRATTTIYRDILQQIWVLDPIPAWTASGSVLSRLQQAPKHHLVDPALAVRLLGFNQESLIDGAGTPLGPQQGTMLGHLFESLVTLCVRVAGQTAEADIRHLRTRNGDHEIDLILVRPDGRILAIEVKLSTTITDRDVRHLHWLRDKIGSQLIDAIVVSTGPSAYRRPDGIGIIPLALLNP